MALPGVASGAVIAGVAKVVVPVSDQARAKEFWTMRAGFEVVEDRFYGRDRWIEVASADGGTVLVLGPQPLGYSGSDAPSERPDSPVFFLCEDIERTYEELRERGVEFPVPPVETESGRWALFADQDGTRYVLQQWSRT
jgi:predicted enzyme related to lactoylglutathione lyase